jgi:hypothetical protein
MRQMRVDFIQRQRQPMLGWLVLIAGVVSAGKVGDHYLQVCQQKEALEQIRQAQAHRVKEQERQRLAAQPLPVPPHVDDKRWQRAATELALPWLNTLQAIERATKPPVFLVGFKSDPVSGRLQLDSEAPSLDDALAYVFALQSAPELSRTQLTAHSEATDQQGRALVRFALQTQWVLTQ